MAEHDRMLEELGRGVGRLKNQSTLINEETSLHVRLLDEMEGDAERASSGLRAEARHAEKVIYVEEKPINPPPIANTSLTFTLCNE